MKFSLVGSLEHQVGSNVDFTTCRRHPFRMCTLWRWVRKHCNSLASCTNGVFSWLVYKIVDILRHRAVQSSFVIATGLMTNIPVIISVLSAFPWVRKSVLPSHVEFAVTDSSISNHHNIFEKHHRFIGWMGLAARTPHSDFDDSADRNQTTWAFVILGDSYDITLGQWRHKTNSLLSAQELWFAVFMTVLLASFN